MLTRPPPNGLNLVLFFSFFRRSRSLLFPAFLLGSSGNLVFFASNQLLFGTGFRWPGKPIVVFPAGVLTQLLTKKPPPHSMLILCHGQAFPERSTNIAGKGFVFGFFPLVFGCLCPLPGRVIFIALVLSFFLFPSTFGCKRIDKRPGLFRLIASICSPLFVESGLVSPVFGLSRNRAAPSFHELFRGK